MRLRVVLFGVLGTAVTVLAAAIVFTPALVQSVQPLREMAGVLDAIERRQLLLVASLLVGLVVSVSTWRVTRAASVDRDAFDEAIAGPPETVTTPRQRLTAASLERTFDEAVDGNADAINRTRQRLREIAVRAYANSVDCERPSAQVAVSDGRWTEDPTAAATLATGDGPTHSPGARLRLWLDPERERARRFEAVIEATRTLTDGER